MAKVRVRETVRLEGIKEMAEEMGVTPQHVRLVYLGKRTSPRIEAALAEQGIKCRRPRRRA